MNDSRPFPIQEDLGHTTGVGEKSTIPWWLAEIAYKQYSRLYGKAQSLERLAQRGGFGRSELLGLLRESEVVLPRCLCPADGVYQLCPVHRGKSSPR